MKVKTEGPRGGDRADSLSPPIRDTPHPKNPGTKRFNAGTTVDDAEINIRTLVFALLALACGHMLSTLLRTIPAISLDVMAADFGTRHKRWRA